MADPSVSVFRHTAGIAAIVTALALAGSRPACGYALYTHTGMIDLAWDDAIRPMLLERFPSLTEAALREAHAFAYGGCLIQDLGYYPFGKALFSDLTHYVRSGDFVDALFRNARNANEYAFAIGALSHFVGDSIGHSQAINRATPMTFPKLEKKYGPVVTYEQDRVAHGRTEFGFDVAQIGWHRYASHAYREYIGFRVALGVLDRAFFETYGLTVHSVLGPRRSAIASYRFSVRKLLPKFVVAEVINNRSRLPTEIQNPALREYLARIDSTEYFRKWGGTYRGQRGFVVHAMAILIRIIPKIGVLKILSIKPPSSATEDLFIASVNNAMDHFRTRLAQVAAAPSAGLTLPNRDLDTGEGVRPGSYILTDKTYEKLLAKITAQPGMKVPPGLRENILLYYSDPNAPIHTKKNKKAWKRVLAELENLRANGGD